ncbi:MAG: hypothetical protein M1343_06935 [Chloroflexi bacterium]|nr:hypothetical protein [Chloroflexota bacterium]MDA8189764.1 hypothetical protein [Dehalococcoidales bacterium]
MRTSDLLLLAAGIAIYLEIKKPGTLQGIISKTNTNFKLPWTDVARGDAKKSPVGTGPIGPTPEELAKSLGVTVYRVREALRRTGKSTATLTLADLAGIPDVPDTVNVGGAASHPNPSGPPATWNNPTGGSGTWGGMTNDQIQASFLASAGGDPVRAQQMWEEQHAREVAERGF